jgi:CheY-like chemotaxis protein
MESAPLPLRILIVDDHQMFREGIRRRLEQEPDMAIVGEADSAEDALEKVAQAKPTIVLLDIRLPRVSGIELARQLRQRWPDLKILVLTGYDFDQYVRAVARVGVSGYLLKTAPQDTVVQAIREVAAGGAGPAGHGGAGDTRGSGRRGGPAAGNCLQGAAPLLCRLRRRPRRNDGRADASRDRGPGADAPGDTKRGYRPPAGHIAADRGGARQQHHFEARRPEPYRRHPRCAG